MQSKIFGRKFRFINTLKISLDPEDSTRESREDSDLYKKSFKLNQL